MKKDEIENNQIGSKVNLIGYISSSRSREFALNFAFKNLNSEGTRDQIPVVLEISFSGKKGMFEMSKYFSAFPGEDEVLIQDGLEYRVLEADYEERTLI